MTRFRFQLEPLLKLREREEREKQLAVAELECHRLELESTLRDHQRFITEGKASLAHVLVGRVDLDDLRGHAAVTLDLTRKAQRVVLELAGIHTRLGRARDELVEASKRRRSMELLRDRRFEAWRAAIDKAENAALDELAVQSAARKES